MGLKGLVKVLPRESDNPILASSLVTSFGLRIAVRELIAPVDSSERRFVASFEGVEVQDGHILTPPSGYGNAVQSSVEELFKHVTGKLLVMSAGSNRDRRSFRMPDNIKVDW